MFVFLSLVSYFVVNILLYRKNQDSRHLGMWFLG